MFFLFFVYIELMTAPNNKLFPTKIFCIHLCQARKTSPSVSNTSSHIYQPNLLSDTTWCVLTSDLDFKL